MPTTDDKLNVEPDAATDNPTDERDEFVPDPQVQAEFGVTAMTLWRWERDPALGFPPAIYIKTRKYRIRRLLEAFKARLLREAIAARGRPADKSQPPRPDGADAAAVSKAAAIGNRSTGHRSTQARKPQPLRKRRRVGRQRESRGKR
jgi:hypothetical protein